MHKAICMAAVLVVAGPGLARAQSPASAPSAASPASPSKKELVARVLKLTQASIEGLARSLTEQPARQLMMQLGSELQRQPAERRDALAHDIEADVRKYVEATAPIVRDKAIKLAPSTIGSLLQDRFSEDELRQIIGVLESPVNKKFQALLPDMQRLLGERLVAESRAEVEAHLRTLQASVAKRLGQTPAGGASAPKASAPTAASAKK